MNNNSQNINMYLRKIDSDDFPSFQADIEKSRSTVERTLSLTWFYIQARFRISEKDFKNIYSVDGANDGGIDCFFVEGNTFYLIQSKYHERSQRESLNSITHEIQKIEKTLIGENSNKYAADFINPLRRVLNNSNVYLEIIWLTTNEVGENTKKDAQSLLDQVVRRRNWQLNVDVNFIDRYALESVIYDIKHGYVPHTGKKVITYEPGECMVIDKGKDNIESVVLNARATEILSWFENSREIEKYLQKNVRESIGDNSINRKIRESFRNNPSLFWYKHNGIIIFADWLELNQRSKRVTIRNPQIVNGAQTISQLYKVFDENRESNNSTKLLVRVYRLPYEDSETYKRSIDIIAALNSQNKIKASDLHSTDPRQVMLENRINELAHRYRYQRKRTEGSKIASPFNILMTKLALHFYVCEYRKPDEGIAGSIESYFEEDKKYADAFPEQKIKKPLSSKVDHIVFKYIDCWKISFFVDRTFKKELSARHMALYPFVTWYSQVDVYNQLQDWKEKVFKGTWREWIDFTSSNYFENGLIRYLKPRYKLYFDMLPSTEVDARNFYKSTVGRNKFLKNSGNFTLFKQEINKVYQQYCHTHS
jgi:hypothetical protein